MLKLTNNVRTNLHEWVDNTLNNFCKEQAIEEHTYIEKNEVMFYDDFHKCFFYAIPTFIHKCLLDKGVGRRFEYKYKPPLRNFLNDNLKCFHKKDPSNI